VTALAAIRDRVGGWLLWPMVRKEFIQMRRDRMTLAMLLVLPAMQLLLFGFAVRTEVRHLPTVVLDESRSRESRLLVSVLEQTQNFRIVGTVADRHELREAIERGRARAAVVVPPDFGRDLKLARTARAQVIVDAADPLSSASALAGAQLAGSVLPVTLAPELQRDGGLVELRVRPWYNPALRSSTFIVPGIVGLLLTLTLLIVMAMAIVREREKGTLEQLVVTPIGKVSMMVGKILPFVLVAYVQMTNVLILGKLVFDVPVRGSLLLLYLLSLPFIAANLGLGLLISALAKTQGAAMQMAMLMMFPSILLSGFIFPREAMPPLAQWLGAAVPLTYYLDILRGILLKGSGLDALWPQTLGLSLFAALTITVSVRKFSKTVE
jgi:ABC-2 type transport system permease protein